MGQIGDAVFRLDHRGILQRLFYIAFVLEPAVAVILGERGRHSGKLVSAVTDIGRRTPVTFNRLSRLKRAPCVIRHHSDAAGDGQDCADPAHLACRLGVKTVQPAANRRIGAGRGDHHTVHLHVDAVDLPTGGFRHDVGPLLRLGQIAPFRWITQGDILYRLDLSGDAGKVDVFDLQPIGQHDAAVLCPQLVARQAGLLHRGLDQRLACDGTGHAQAIIHIRHGGRAAGDMQPHQLAHDIDRTAPAACQHRVRGRGNRQRLCPDNAVVVNRIRRTGRQLGAAWVNVELFGDHMRLHRPRALPHIRARRDQRDPLGVYFNVGGDRGFAGFQPVEQRVLPLAFVKIGAKDDAACDSGRADQEAAAGNCFHTSHITPPSA